MSSFQDLDETFKKHFNLLTNQNFINEACHRLVKITNRTLDVFFSRFG